jgi:hypothetical protein
MAIDDSTREQVLRDRAVTQLKKRRDFHAHLLVYVLVNGCLVVFWAFTTMPGFFWPMFLIAIWGIGLVMNAWDVYWRREINEDEIQREMEHMGKH